MTEEQVSAIENRWQATTPGQWTAVCIGSEGHSIFVDHGKPIKERPFLGPVADVVGGKDWKELCANAEFLGHVHADVPDLLAEVRRLKAENTQLRKVSEGFMDIAGAALSRGRVPE